MKWFTAGTICALGCQLLVAAASRAEDWRQWGGPNRNFQVVSTGLADRWSEDGPKRIWSRSLGPGYSSIAVAGDKLLTMYRRGDADVVVALHKDTGKTLWEHVYEAPLLAEQDKEYGTGPNSSPLVLDDRLITIGFTGKMNCLSLASGDLLWSHDLVSEYGGKTHEYGYSASPIEHGGHVIVLNGGEKSGVIAFNPSDGSVAWQSKPHDVSYASPIIINVDGQDQLVFFASTEIIGLDANDGKFLWKHPCVNKYKNNATDPIWGEDNILWVVTQLDGGGRALKLKQRDGKTTVEQIWSNSKVKIFHWNAVRIDDHVYASIGSTSTSTIAAIDIKTGQIAWRERGFSTALFTHADNKLIFLDRNGQLGLARVSPLKWELLSKVQLTNEVCWTVPTLVGRTLYVRDTKNIMALDLGS